MGDLRFASPATVSRAGMVYVDPKNLGHQPFMDRWIKSKSASDEQFLSEMCAKYVNPAVTLILDGMVGKQRVRPLGLVIPQTGLNMVGYLFF